MTTTVVLMLNGECEVLVHRAARDEHGRFVRDGEPTVGRSTDRNWIETHLPDGMPLIIEERPLRKVGDPPETEVPKQD